MPLISAPPHPRNIYGHDVALAPTATLPPCDDPLPNSTYQLGLAGVGPSQDHDGPLGKVVCM